MLREQVINEWIVLKEKINQTLNSLQTKLRYNNNPEIWELEIKLFSILTEIRRKQSQLAELDNFYYLSSLYNGGGNLTEQKKQEMLEAHEQIRKLNEEMQELKNSRNSLEESLAAISSLNPTLASCQEQIKSLNYLYSLKGSLEGRGIENEQFLGRIKRAEEKWTNSEKKLELVRDLLGSDQVSKLLDFYKKGKI